MIVRALLIVAVLVMAVLALRQAPSTRGLAVRRMALLAFTVAWIVAVLSPDLLSRLARLVGVGRGTDLLLYALVVAVALGAIGVSRRFLTLERRLADLTRQLAIASVTKDDVERPALRVVHSDADDIETPAAR